ncbi:MAG: gamma-glutamyl kinase [Sulfuricurvum sp. PC08-66]|nr:MAG: gamma-glutamyl kinase [Sulfuricurvum sp. PC08-66]
MERIVIKVGTAVLTEQNRIAKERMQALVEFIVALRVRYEVILVSSGAVAAGYTQLQLDKKELANKQALAAIGQPILMSRYKKKLEPFGVLSAQVLLTKANFYSSEQIKRAKATMEVLLAKGVLPIVNENDATAVEELVVGDNDQLSAFVAHHFDANMLVILSDIDAYYDKDPNLHADAKPLKKVHEISAEALAQDAVGHNAFATGGIVTKLKAAHFLLQEQRSMFLTSGFELAHAKAFLLEGVQEHGTLFTPRIAM